VPSRRCGLAYRRHLRRGRQKTLADNRQIVFIEERHPDAAAVAVFETGYNLFRGKYIYIDDLSTLPTQRGKGYAGMLLDWIMDYAKRKVSIRSISIRA
jgi:GNAT superfamily N-acetyltransferase